MNRCSSGGYLVGGAAPLPSEPTDHDVETLPRLGCNRLLCSGCGAAVRSAGGMSLRDSTAKLDCAALYDVADLAASPLLKPVAGFRFYLCRCNRYLQKNNEDALADKDPDEQTPNVPWRCAGHPLVELPATLDGVSVTAENLGEVITRALRGGAPPQAHPESRVGGYWAARMYVRFDGTPWQDAIVAAVVAGLSDAEPQARARALHFFRLVPAKDGQERGLELLQGDRALFTGVPVQLAPIEGDKTLEEWLWRVVAPLVKSPGRARELAQAEALTGKASGALYAALAAGDPAWFVEHLDELAESPGVHGQGLANAARWSLPKHLRAATMAAVKALLPDAK